MSVAIGVTLILSCLALVVLGALLSLLRFNALKKSLEEKRTLPTGMTEFEEWSDRIISGSCLTATPESQKFALAEMLMHLGPTVDHETDLHFIKCLRKGAVNQIAHARLVAIKEAAQARMKQEKEAKEQGEAKSGLSVVSNP